MDDGHLKKSNGVVKKIILSTDSFTQSENLQLIKLLEKKFSLYFSLDGQNRLILYDQLQIVYFCRLVHPYLHPSMDRKMMKSKHLSDNIFPKRTTIYLPKDIKLTKPTFEINSQLQLLSKLYKIVYNREDYIYHYKIKISLVRNHLNTKQYQVVIESGYWSIINDIKKITGLNNSQVVTLCFYFNN